MFGVNKPINLSKLNILKIIKNNRNKISVITLLVLANGGISFFNFLTNIVIANNIGRSDFGEYGYSLTLGLIMLTFIMFGFDRTLVRDLVQNSNREKYIFLSSLVIRGVLYFVSLIGLFIYIFISKDISWGMGGIILAVGLNALEIRSIYDVWRQIKRHTVYYLLQRIVYFSLIWIVILFFPSLLSIQLIGIFLFFTALGGLVIQYYWVFQQFTSHDIKIKNIILETYGLIQKSYWAWFAALNALLISSFNQIVLKNVSNSEELGGYYACWLFVTACILVISQVARVGKPLLAVHSTEEKIKNGKLIPFFIKYLLVIFVISGILALPMILMPNILLSVFNTDYSDVKDIMVILGIEVLIYASGLVFSQFLIMLHEDKFYFNSLLLGGIVSIVLSIYLIPLFQGIGAALTIVISHFISVLLYAIKTFFLIKKINL